MQLSEQQSFNQALIKLSVLLYQVDGMVTLSEQDYLNA
ncbi:MAG: TerB family tellurite resistance protein, partial [Pseudomonadota bacterium]|nr:TerB family tellurite resistance protein [Pseudomonadota bacterium]